jgi:hypothetical protein
VSQCTALLTFDLTQYTTDYATLYSVFDYINENNYAQYQQQYSATIPDYFSGGYSDFSSKRSELQRLFASSGYTTNATNYYSKVLSPGVPQAYAECVARVEGKQISAWVSATDENNSVISVTVKNGAIGNSQMSYVVVGTQPNNLPSVLASGGSEILDFTYVPNDGFDVSFNATVAQTGAQDAAAVSYPSNIRYRKSSTDSPKTGVFQCQAGGDGNPSHHQFSTKVTISADQDSYLLPSTLGVISRRVTVSPGINQYQLQSTYNNDLLGRPSSVTVEAINISGNSADSTGTDELICQIFSRKEFITTP